MNGLAAAKAARVAQRVRIDRSDFIINNRANA